MNNRKNALLLSGFLLICVWLILFLVAVTEEGATAYNFGIASTIAGTCGAVCMIVWIVLDVVEERKDASGIYNFEYYRLMRKKKAYEIVYRDLMKVDLFRGHYDAKNGSETFVRGIGTVMENIALHVSEETANKYMQEFTNNIQDARKRAKP